MDMEEDVPLNVYASLSGLFPMLIVKDPPFKDSLNWLQFAYTAERVGDYVAPASTDLAQSAISEEDELFPEILKHLWRLYLEVYSPAVSLGRAPAHRDFHLRDDGAGLSGGNLLNNRFNELDGAPGVPSPPPGRLGRPHKYPKTRIGDILHTDKTTPPPTPHTHTPPLLRNTHRCIPQLVRRSCAGIFKKFQKWKMGGIPCNFFATGIGEA